MHHNPNTLDMIANFKNLNNFALPKTIKLQNPTDITLQQKKKRASCSDKLTFLNRLLFKRPNFYLLVSKFFCFVFLGGCTDFDFFFFVVIVRLLFLKFSIFFSFIFFLSINFVLSFFSS